ncbi:MAG: YdeI/OmpD-associated family protein [Calditrichaeota bacterium]|nr:YdeI/OmpD-associated family protein [Calditrichota bacterium]
MDPQESSRLKRPLHEMPEYVKVALEKNNLMEPYRERPPYQQNDYIGWINRAKRQETKERRLAQMLEELRRGDKYMKMDYRAKKS